MPDSDRTILTGAQSLVLYVVWLAQHEGGAAGLTNEEIQAALQREYRVRSLPGGTSLPNTKVIIGKLTKWNPPLLIASRAGRGRKVYALNRRNLAISRTTASILKELDTYFADPISKTLFIQKIEAKQMVKSDSTPISREMIEKALSFSMNTADPYVSESSNGDISTTNRVETELPFLNLIRYPSPPAIPSAVSEAGPSTLASSVDTTALPNSFKQPAS